ncbi:permease-like cell division protein FtsX [Gayadomonas joobiniege]|uniref:permease-like cell division protein FtsX n=1 Tax=Gayadomonas joobiniege TaxID=1234606 RepID=UPI00036ADCF8|nr:permease-like cell division protein FtsX [Gayadomonas joobiniege]
MSLLFKRRSSGATERKLTIWQKITAFFLAHVRQWLASLGGIWRDPIPSLLTVAVLGVSLTLPATLYVIVKNTQSVEDSFQNAAQISLFLKQQSSQQETAEFVRRLQQNHKIEAVQFISASAGLAEFSQSSGFNQALSLLDENPLPDVVLVIPAADYRTASAAQTLLEELESAANVDAGKLDITWLKRLNAIVSLVQSAMSALTLLLCLSVLLIVGNTIRLSIVNRREEIEVQKLVGATNAYIHRPFLYTGLWYGFFGGLIAWLSIEVIRWNLSGAISEIASLYQSDYILIGLSANEMLFLLGISMGLGLAGSYLVVRGQIKQIEPES